MENSSFRRVEYVDRNGIGWLVLWTRKVVGEQGLYQDLHPGGPRGVPRIAESEFANDQTAR